MCRKCKGSLREHKYADFVLECGYGNSVFRLKRTLLNLVVDSALLDVVDISRADFEKHALLD